MIRTLNSFCARCIACLLVYARKKSFISLAAALSLLPALTSHGQEVPVFQWAKQTVAGAGDDYGFSVTTDAAGNVYTLGEFTQVADFDPGPGTFNLTPVGSRDIYLSKLDADGNFVWALSFGSAGLDGGLAIVNDPSGGFYICGYNGGSMDYDPGPGNVTLSGYGYFFSKFDNNGNFIRASLIQDIRDIGTDGSGNFYATGMLSGTFDFDFGAGSFPLTSGGGSDIYIFKLNTAGDLQWANKIGGVGADAGQLLSVSNSGDVYLTGTFTGTVDFDPGTPTANLAPVGASDFFICKLNAAGSYQWAKAIGGTGVSVHGIGTNAAGDVYTTGNLQGTVDFDPGTLSYNLTSAGGFDVFLSKLDASGNFQWAYRWGSAGSDESDDLAVGPDGSVYTTGYFSNIADFDPGAATFNLTSAGNQDIFISKINASGNFAWATRTGSGSTDEAYSIGVDNSGNILLTSFFYQTADFDPTCGVTTLTSSGSQDVFVQKLSVGFVPTITLVSPSLGPYGTAITITGTDFSTTLAKNFVKFNGTSAVVTASTSTSITTTLPVGATTGLVTVRVGCNTGISPSIFTVTSIPSYIPVSGLVGYWPLTGNANDISGNGNNGTAVGATLTIDQFDNANRAYHVDGNDYLNMADSPTLRPVNVTVAGWFRFSSNSVTQVLIDKHLGTLGNDSYEMWYESNTLRGAVGNAGGLGPVIDTPFTPAVGDWYRLAFSYDDASNTQKLYINGCLAATTTNATTSISYDAEPLRVGANNDNLTPGSFFTGDMDEILIWNRALSDAEVRSSMAGLFSFTSFNPDFGLPGSTVTIDGRNFSSIPGDNMVDFNGTPAVVTASTRQTLTVIVPAGATSGPVTVSRACFSNTSEGEFTVTGSSCVPAAERNALIALYNATDGANWTNSTNWLSANESSWYGVTITGCHVTGLSLNGNNLAGSIPPEISSLPKLASLNLGSNQLRGQIPPEVGYLNELLSLDLSINQFVGAIPLEIGYLATLQVLNLSFNQLEGNIPFELEYLSALTSAFLGNNKFTGDAPLIGGNTGPMNTLQLQFNQLTGLPDLTQYPAILSVNVSNNRLEFDDLEPYLGVADFTYAPQALIPPGGVLSFIPGGTLDIPFNTGGTGNIYQWYKDNIVIPGATASSLSLPTTTAADVGTYEVRITSSVVPLLTLVSEPFTVITDPCPSGTRTAGDLDAGFAPVIGAPSTFSQPALQSNGKIIVGTNYTIVNSIVTSGILRFNADGTLDNTFATNPYGPGFIVQPDNKIVSTYFDGAYAHAVRMDADGNDDNAFNTNAPQYYSGSITAMGIQPDGKILVAATDYMAPAFVERLNTDGTSDGSFSAPAGLDVTVIKVQPDGYVLLGGEFTGGITRLDPAGAVDAGFNTSGASDFVTDIAVQPDGKIIVTGLFNFFDGIPHRGLVRLNPDGSLDNSFTPYGITDIIDGGSYPARIAIQTDGKIVLAGIFISFNGAYRINLIRLNIDGTVDCSLDAGASTDATIDGLALQPDGKILITGSFNTYEGISRKGLARLNNGGPAPVIMSDGSVQFCNVQFLDPGGPGDYLSNQDITETFSPQVAGDKVKVSFSSYSTEQDFDYLYVYDGPTTASPLVATLTGTSLPADITATSAGGQLTFRFHSDGDVEKPGWVATLSCQSGVAITITTQPSDAIVCVGSTATFNTDASGTTNITYQWQFSPDGIAPFADISSGGGYSGTTTKVLSVNTTGTFGAGRYRCKINGDLAPTVYTNDEGLFINAVPSSPTTTPASSCVAASLILTASGGSPGEYRWYTVASGGAPLAGEVNDTYATPVLSVTTSYFVSINNGSCESSRTSVAADVTILSKPALTTSNCTATSATLTGPAGFTTYAWSNGASTPQINVTAAGSFTLVVTASNGCTSPVSDPTVFTSTFCNQSPVIAATPINTVIEGAVSVSLLSTLSDPDNNLDLSTLKVFKQPTSGAVASIGTNATLLVDYKGSFFAGKDEVTVEVCDFAGFCTQQVLSIDVAGEIVVHTGISPDGNGQNDKWIIQYIEAFPDTKDNHVSLFNRWGDAVFETSNYDNVNRVFTGMNKGGDALPTGTYFYKIEFASGKKTMTGYLSLKR